MSVSAFRMQLKPGAVAEYKARHDAIWPELSELLSDAGIRDYRIFLDEGTLSLFAIMHLSDCNRTAELGENAVMRRWWDYMADLMDVHVGNRPMEWPLQQVFHHP